MKDDKKKTLDLVVDCTADGVDISNGIKMSNNGKHCDGMRKRAAPPLTNHTNHIPQAMVEPAHDDVVSETEIPTRTQVLTDWANLCTFVGAVLATLAMACMWKKRYYLGMFLNMSANIADIIDGPIARSLPGRHPIFSVVGCKLDCYSDLVSHFVVPASLLMSISDMHPFCVILAALYVCSGILRQSYFEVTGRCENGTCIYGMTSDYMVAIYCIAMHLMPLIGPDRMIWVLSLAVVVMMFGSLTFSLRSRRYEGFGLFTVTLFNVLLSISCIILLVYSTNDGSVLPSALLITQLALAYPCYFRFVELNN